MSDAKSAALSPPRACTCAFIMLEDASRHFRGCARREDYPAAPEPRLALLDRLGAALRAKQAAWLAYDSAQIAAAKDPAAHGQAALDALYRAHADAHRALGHARGDLDDYLAAEPAR